MTGDLAPVKRRLAVMATVNAVALVTALAAGVGYFRFALDWALVVFAVALVSGFAAQIWFIAGFRRMGKGA